MYSPATLIVQLSNLTW